MNIVHQTALFFHLGAILLIGGGSIGAILGEKQLWKGIIALSPGIQTWLTVIQSATRFIYIGMVVFIISGTILLYSVNWVFITQGWFIAKLICFILLPVRGAVVGRRTIARIQAQLQNTGYNMPALMKLKTKMIRFHTIQFILVAAIIFLVLFKV
jgi:hypothetical protein